MASAEQGSRNTSAGFWRGALRTYVRRFPIGRGKHYLTETFAPLYVKGREEICRLPGGAAISLDLREHVQRRIYFFGVYEQQTVPWFRSALKPGMTFLDIGAHVGQYTLIGAADVGTTGRVHSFEPNPATLDRLRANLDLNGYAHAQAHPIALSNTGGSATLFVPTHDNLGEASLQACVESRETTVRSITLDEWAETADLGESPRLDLVKIDVQGFEQRVIEGGKKVLARFRPTILCEFEERWLTLAGTSSVALKRMFLGLGYQVNKVVGTRLVPVPVDEVHYFENLVLTPIR